MTALFYLLSMSGSRFKPLQVLTEINFFKSNQSNRISRGQLLSRAIEDSIRSVFVASLKMAAFFGLYTYSINCLFGVNIVYLPSIISGLFAVLPLIGTYWFCIPGLLELWLIYDSPVLAVLFVIMHLLPYILSVDKAIYSEIKGGHPYLTGLAFAGGVYCLGLEGAIIGPIILCLFIVIGRIVTTATANNMRNSVSITGITQVLKTPSAEKQT
jgi:predicted PurR-regulated permease PerM